MKQYISPNNFILELQKTNGINEVQGNILTKEVDIVGNFLNRGIIIRDCEFTERVFIHDSELGYGIKFINCRFAKNLTISNSKASEYDHEFNFQDNHIEITGTEIKELYIFDTKFERGITINEGSTIHTLEITNFTSNLSSLNIKDSTVHKKLDLFRVKSSGSIAITDNCNINCKVRIESPQTGYLTITNSTFAKDIHIVTGIVNYIIFNDGTFNDDVNITSNICSEGLTIIGSEFKKSIVYKTEKGNNYGTLKKVYISSAKFGNQFVMNGENMEIGELTIPTSKQLEGTIYFNSCEIEKTKISGNNYNANIIFNHCNFNLLNFDFLYNYATISIISAKATGKESELSIDHSNLGKTNFFNTFFNTFDKINVYNSILTEIITANVKWFDPKKLNVALPKDKNSYAQNKEIFRQLKFASEKQGNRVDALDFKSAETSYLKKELFSSTKWHRRLFNKDRFILWLGQTNNFGLNWWKPFWLVILFGLIFYCLIIVGVSEKLSYSIDLSSESIKTTFSELTANFKAFPQLMNPVHSLDKVFENSPNLGFWVHFFDYTLKLFLAFFIFQIISAFRKYVK